MRLQRLKKYAIGAGGMLVLVMAILLATGWGSAVAAQISNVFVTNNASHPVPVRAQSSAQVLYDAVLPGGTEQEVNVSSAGAIRVAAHLTPAGCTSQPNGSESIGVESASHSGATVSDQILIGALHLSCDFTNGTRDDTATYVLPGAAITLVFAGGVESHVMVFGRP